MTSISLTTSPFKLFGSRLLVLLAPVLVFAACSSSGSSGDSGDTSAATSPTVSATTSSSDSSTSLVAESDPDEHPAQVGEIRATECFPSVADVGGATCSFLTVLAQDPGDASRTYDIAYAILPALDASTESNPIVVLSGGPGASAIMAAEEFVGGPLAALRSTADVILLDQRATGFSDPDLSCPGAEDMVACRAQLTERGIDPATVNSALIASDIEQLRQILGHEQIKLWGGSYGTRLGLTVMRDYPTSVEAAVLDSVFGPEVNNNGDSLVGGLSTIDAALTSCEESPFCSSRHPGLRSKVETRFSEPDGFEAMATVYFSFESEVTPMKIMDIVAAIVEGGPISDSGLEEGPEEGPGGPGDSEPGFSQHMNWSVHCQEEDPSAPAAIIPQGWSQDLIDVLTDPEMWAENQEMCNQWDVPLSPPLESEPVFSDVPSLVMVGTFDTRTPPLWSTSGASYLSNSTIVTFDGIGHMPSMLSDCGAQIAAQFLADPAVLPDTGCMPVDAFS